MTINDAHCHFFSTAFLAALASRRAVVTGNALQTPAEISAELGWNDPGEPDELADRVLERLRTPPV